MARLSGLTGMRIALDTSVFIYALESHAEFGPVCLELFETIEEGGVRASASDLILAELMVRPLRLGRRDVAERYLATLPTFPNLVLRTVSRAVVTAAAQVRARSGLQLVDALHVASAIEAGAQAFVTNDVRLAEADAGIRCLLVRDLG